MIEIPAAATADAKRASSACSSAAVHGEADESSWTVAPRPVGSVGSRLTSYNASDSGRGARSAQLACGELTGRGVSRSIPSSDSPTLRQGGAVVERGGVSAWATFGCE